jgi:hypothetical protein
MSARARKSVRRAVAARAAHARTVPRRERPSAPRKLRPGARPKSLGLYPLTKEERRQRGIDEGVLRRAGVDQRRPRTYSECEPRTGPCGFVSCRFNLYLEVDDLTGAVKLNFPDKEIDELEETCALRVAGRGGHSLEQVGKMINLTQERVSQIEESGAAKLKRRLIDVRRLLRVARPDSQAE